MNIHPKYKYVKRSEGYYMAGALIDSEWKALQGMSTDDLWNYLSAYEPCMKQGLSREESDLLWKTMLS